MSILSSRALCLFCCLFCCLGGDWEVKGGEKGMKAINDKMVRRSKHHPTPPFSKPHNPLSTTHSITSRALLICSKSCRSAILWSDLPKEERLRKEKQMSRLLLLVFLAALFAVANAELVHFHLFLFSRHQTPTSTRRCCLVSVVSVVSLW